MLQNRARLQHHGGVPPHGNVVIDRERIQKSGAGVVVRPWLLLVQDPLPSRWWAEGALDCSACAHLSSLPAQGNPHILSIYFHWQPLLSATDRESTKANQSCSSGSSTKIKSMALRRSNNRPSTLSAPSTFKLLSVSKNGYPTAHNWNSDAGWCPSPALDTSSPHTDRTRTDCTKQSATGNLRCDIHFLVSKS